VIYLILYLFAGIIFAYKWYFKHVKYGASLSEWSFFLILTVFWPFPFLTEVVLKYMRF
jgi:hypothetical protein